MPTKGSHPYKERDLLIHFSRVLIMYCAIYVLFMTARSAYISALKLSFRNMNHTCSIRFDTSIMKRRCFFVCFFLSHLFFVVVAVTCAPFLSPLTIVLRLHMYVHVFCIFILDAFGFMNTSMQYGQANELQCIGIDKQRTDSNLCNREKCRKHNISLIMTRHVNLNSVKMNMHVLVHRRCSSSAIIIMLLTWKLYFLFIFSFKPTYFISWQFFQNNKIETTFIYINTVQRKCAIKEKQARC